MSIALFHCRIARIITVLVTTLTISVAVAVAGQPPGDRQVSVEVHRLLLLLKQQQDNRQAGTDPWAETMRSLISLGPAAVPTLITTLKETPIEERLMLRSLPFILRGIGDPRAVPALIQTLPKCNWKDGSDMGYSTDNRELAAFLQRHDKNARKTSPNQYRWGRPINEVRTALNSLTAVEHGEMDLVYVRGRDGTPRQQHLAAQAFHRCATRWANWWHENWSDFTEEETYSTVSLPDPIAVASSLFDFDRHVPLAVIARSSGSLCEPWQTGGGRVFCDLDIKRFGGLHPRWEDLESRTNNAIIRKWAISEGFDLMGRSEDVDGRNVYLLEVIAGEVWRVPASVWQQEKFTDAMEIIDQALPVDGILATGEDDYQNNDTWFIITRHGTPLLLRQGVEVHDTNVKIGTPSRGDANRNPVGFYKGRRFALKMLAEQS